MEKSVVTFLIHVTVLYRPKYNIIKMYTIEYIILIN
jgi:hypothetical protein